MAAKVAGAAVIIAVDIVQARLQTAMELGATHVIDASADEPYTTIMSITGAGTHYALDTTGRVDIIRNALGVVRAGGACGVLGAAPPGKELSIDYNLFMGTSKVLRGIVEGDSVPDIFIPRLISLYLQGRFPFDRLVKFYPLEQINAALEDSAAGRTIKPILRMPA